ncbi:methyltransferase domain-containing protein [candidate division CSSED10-310 bacterium]|uniref:Methyltransferase domain-containing protein n=1 Tax=candidate division CSSED10-310 bacterium TaxID=2855610 RepID=A0ABV6YYC7_UNCC1
MVFQNFKDPYSFCEALMYDFLIASAVASFIDDVQARFVERIPARAKVLDVGCGGGQNASNLLNLHSAIHLTGLDLSFNQIKRARKRLQKFKMRNFCVQGSALNLPFEAAGFDVVYSIASLKHWPHQDQGLKECHRVLRPGGFLLIIEADRACSLPDTQRFVERWNIPFFLRPLAVLFFRAYVAGQSLDLLEARTLWGNLAFQEAEVEKLPNTPALIMFGEKM